MRLLNMAIGKAMKKQIGEVIFPKFKEIQAAADAEKANAQNWDRSRLITGWNEIGLIQKN